MMRRRTDTDEAADEHSYSHGEGTTRPGSGTNPRRRVSRQEEDASSKITDELTPGQIYGGMGDAAGQTDSIEGANDDAVG